MPKFPIEFYDNIPDYNFDFTTQCAYKIINRRIFIRALSNRYPVTIHSGIRVPTSDFSWRLQDDFGVPFKINKDGIKQSLLSDHEYLIEINVAGELITVRTNLNRLYCYKPTDTKLPTIWHGLMGQPFKKPLYLPNDTRCWDVGLSTTSDPIKPRRTEFIATSELVEYSEDAIGVKHQFGFTYTTVALLQDKIIYTDTGLQGFTTSILLPKLNDTHTGVAYIAQGQMISYAGSTVFISFIDKYNNIGYATIYECYDINGAHPGLEHSIVDINKVSRQQLIPDHDEIIPITKGVRNLPFSKWNILSLTGITEDYKLTTKISIHVTGTGNAARELRIVAISNHGQHGYFRKSIDEEAWQFVKANFILTNERIPLCSIRPYNHNSSNPLRNYTCVNTSQILQDRIKIRLLQFNSSLSVSEPAVIEITRGQSTAYIKLYLITGWNLDVYPLDSSLRGSVAGLKKMSRGSLLIDGNNKFIHDSVLRKFIIDNFERYNNQTNSIGILSDESNVQIITKDGELLFHFLRPLTPMEFNETLYMKIALNNKLLLHPRGTNTLEELISANTKSLMLIDDIHKIMKRQLLKFFVINKSSHVISPLIKMIAKPAHRFLPITYDTCLKTYYDAEQLFYFQSRADIDALLRPATGFYESKKIITDRIDNLKIQSDFCKIKSTSFRRT